MRRRSKPVSFYFRGKQPWASLYECTKLDTTGIGSKQGCLPSAYCVVSYQQSSRTMSALRICYIPLLLIERAQGHKAQWGALMTELVRRECVHPEGLPSLLCAGANMETLAQRSETFLRCFEQALRENLISVWPEKSDAHRFPATSVVRPRDKTHDCDCFWYFYLATVCDLETEPLSPRGGAFGLRTISQWWRSMRHDMMLYSFATFPLEDGLQGCGRCGVPAKCLTLDQQWGLSALGNLATSLWLADALGCEAEKALFRAWLRPVLTRMQWYWAVGVDGCALQSLPPFYEDDL